MNSFQWGMPAVRLGALVLYASLPIWMGSMFGAAAVAAYEVSRGADRTYALIGVGNYAAPTMVTWLLARIFWRRADRLFVLPDDDPEAPTDTPQHGEELLTAGLILFGAYELVTRASTPFGVWSLYYFNWMEYGSADYYDDPLFNAVVDRWAVAFAFEIIAGLFLVFAGRRIARRLCARDRFQTSRRSSPGQAGGAQ